MQRYKRFNIQLTLLCSLLAGCISPSVPPEIKQKARGVPEVVRSQFKQRHPEIDPVFVYESVANKDLYEVEFKSNGRLLSESYNREGRLVDTEEEIASKDMPSFIWQRVKLELNERYADFKMIHIQKLLRDGKSFFEVKISTEKSPSRVMDVLFDSQGKWLEEGVVHTEAIPSLN